MSWKISWWLDINHYDLVSSELWSKARIVLICEGLDTVSKIYINNNLVGESENMFVRYIYNIKGALQVFTINQIIYSLTN